MEIALIYISIKNNMDTQTIVKGLINEYIKPKYPIYKVEYVEIEQVYCEEDDEPAMKPTKIIGLFNLLPDNIHEKKLTGKHQGKEMILMGIPIAQGNLCKHTSKFGISQQIECEEERAEIQKTMIKEHTECLPFINKYVIDAFVEDNRIIQMGGNDVMYIFKNIERVA